MNFKELGKDLQSATRQIRILKARYAEDVEKATERFKGGFLDARLADLKQTHESELYAVRSKAKAEIAALRKEKIALADQAATKPPTADMMALLQAQGMRKNIPKSEILAAAKATQGNYLALSILRDLAQDKGYHLDVADIEQTKKRINDAADLAVSAIDGATAIWIDDMIEAYNEAEKRRDAMTMVVLNGRIHAIRNGGKTAWDTATRGLDEGFTSSPVITRVLTPGERELVKRMFDGVPANKLQDKVNDKAAESPEMRVLIELSDFASLLETEGNGGVA